MNPLGAAVAAVSLVGSLAGDSTNYWSVPPETRAALVESARKGFVELRFRFAPYDPASGVDQNRWWKTRSSYGADEMWQNRQSARLQGARASGGFFAAGLGDYDVEHLERLTAVDADGREHPARPWGVSRRGGMVWLKAEGLEDAPLPARAPFTVPEKGFSARLSARAPDSRVSVSAWSKPRPRNEAPFLRSFDRPGAPASPNSRLDESYDMLFDSSATWRGWIRGRGWDEDDELVDPESARKAALPWEDFLRARREAEKRASGALAVARLRFRPEAVDAVGLYGLSLASSDEDRERQVKTRVDVALPVGGGRLFVPTRLSPALVQRLESVELVRGGKATPARFVGVLKGPYEGWLLASDDAGPALGGGKETADDELMLAVEPRLSGESLRVRSFADRLDGWSYSYKESLRRKPRAASERGTLLCGLDGLPFAVIVEEARYENVVDRDSWRVPTPLLALHPLDELVRELSGPEAALVDAAVRPRSVLENKRRPWLGVETQDLTADLSRLLGVAGPTQDGSVGQLVNAVLPGSPAAKLGLKPGDVILRLREAGKSDEVTVKPKSRYSPLGSGGLIDWFKRPQTGLDAALSRLQAGTKVSVFWARGADQLAGEAELVESPLDVESAPKHVDKGLGLTVKEITDDVRRLLKLKPGFKGLLVYDVESGSPAAVAGFAPTALLTEAAGKPLASLADLTAAVAAERAAKKPTIRLRAAFFGRSRYAELRLPPEGK